MKVLLLYKMPKCILLKIENDNILISPCNKNLLLSFLIYSCDMETPQSHRHPGTPICPDAPHAIRTRARSDSDLSCKNIQMSPFLHALLNQDGMSVYEHWLSIKPCKLDFSMNK